MGKETKKTAASGASKTPAAETSQEFDLRNAEYRRLYMSTPEKAKKTLQNLGILNKSGKLAKAYR